MSYSVIDSVGSNGMFVKAPSTIQVHTFIDVLTSSILPSLILNFVLGFSARAFMSCCLRLYCSSLSDFVRFELI